MLIDVSVMFSDIGGQLAATTMPRLGEIVEVAVCGIFVQSRRRDPDKGSARFVCSDE